MNESPRPLHWIDIGANLTHEAFRHDLDAVIVRAQLAGVVQMIVTGANCEHSHRAAQLAKTRPTVLFATAGVHPHHANEYTDDCDAELRALHAYPEVVAVGECGLDYFRDFSPRPAQRLAFARQLQLACEIGKPVFLHQRDAHSDFMAILRECGTVPGPMVVHCFTGTREELFACLDHGCYIGLTGWLCDERRGLPVRELIRHIPAERLMLETDAPYLLPRTLSPMPRDRRNEPAFLPHIARHVAQARGEDVAMLASNACAVTRAFFHLPEPE